ncbi:MAG: hypothetical protein ACE5HX_00065 [bacterium]
MSLIRLLLYGLLFYFAYKIVNSFLRGFDKKAEVKGSRKGNPPIDLKNQDVEDADFEEIKE